MQKFSNLILLTSALITLGSVIPNPSSEASGGQLLAGPAGWLGQLELGLNVNVALFILGSVAVGFGLKNRPRTTLAILACMAWSIFSPENGMNWMNMLSSLWGFAL